MKPTMELRFVKRPHYISRPDIGPTYGEHSVRFVLQQWWEESDWGGPADITPPGEWRDVPVEVENER